MSRYTAEDGRFGELDGIRYTVLKPLVWHLGFEDSPLVVTVPVGFVFDVSVPRLLRWLFSPREKAFLKAAALHDWLLKQGWSRVEAAGPFERALAADGVALWRRLAMFLAVALWDFR